MERRIEELLTSGTYGSFEISKESRILHQIVRDYVSGKLEIEEMRVDHKQRLYNYAVKHLDGIGKGKAKLEQYIHENGMKLREGVTIEEDAGIPYFMVDGNLKLATRSYNSMFLRMKKNEWIVVV